MHSSALSASGASGRGNKLSISIGELRIVLFPNQRYDLLLVDESTKILTLSRRLLQSFIQTTKIFGISLHVYHPKLGNQILKLNLDRTWSYSNAIGTEQPETQMKYLDESFPQQVKIADLNS